MRAPGGASGVGAAAFGVLVLLAGCVVDLDRGQEGFPCNPGGVCGLGLECEDGFCVRPSGPNGNGTGNGGGNGGNGNGNGEEPECLNDTHCEPDWICVDGTCEEVIIPSGCQRGETVPCYDIGAPELAGVGVCSRGVRVCLGDDEWSPCFGDGAPSREVCDGQDNSCDGVIDTPERVGLLPCYEDGAQGVCAQGFQEGCDGPCVFIGFEDHEGPLGPETSDVCGDDLDNNCSGVPEDGCACDDREGTPCYGLGLDHPTLGVGECRGGTIGCQGPWIRRCEGQVLPRQERCDGTDRNCDGVVDSDDPLLGTPCTTGEPGICSEGRYECHDGTLVCVPVREPLVPTGEPEILCDGIDESCSGVADDGLEVPGAAANCAAHESCCEGGCVDFQTDFDHCGACGEACEDDGDPCTEVRCEEGECVIVPFEDGDACDDQGRICLGGACVYFCEIDGLLYAPGDRSADDVCMGCFPGVDDSAFTPVENGAACPEGICHNAECKPGCYIDGSYRDPGILDPTSVCRYCDPAVSRTAWSPRTGAGCDDGNPCTGSGTCTVDGDCGASPLGGGTSCGSGLVCDGEGVCHSACWIDGALVDVGTIDGTNCGVCDPSVDAYDWTPRATGTQCQSDRVCDGEGSCVGACFIDGNLVSPGTIGGPENCHSCDTSVNLYDWTFRGTGVSCDDAMVCDSSAQCRLGCYIDSNFREHQEIHPTNECRWCHAYTSTTSWTNRADGTSCVDSGGLPGTCSSGTCL